MYSVCHKYLSLNDLYLPLIQRYYAAAKSSSIAPLHDSQNNRLENTHTPSAHNDHLCCEILSEQESERPNKAAGLKSGTYTTYVCTLDSTIS
jgi:hypothetical protein